MTTLAQHRGENLQRDARAHGISLSLADARILRRAELTLHRWDERRCGWSTPGPYGASFALVRDEDGDGRAYLEIHPNVGLKTRWERVPDIERGALNRIEAICAKYDASYYRQSDPRGASLYIDREPIPDNNYTRAVCCAVR